MIAKEDCYCGEPLMGSRRVTQGYPLPPTISNMVIGMVIQHWETRVTGEDAGKEGFGRAVKNFPPSSKRTMAY